MDTQEENSIFNAPKPPAAAAQTSAPLPVPASNPDASGSRQMLVIVIIISVLAGAVGGAGASVLALKKGLISGNAPITANNQLKNAVNLDENSAIIDVVKKTSPAVVSIIISQDLNKIPGYGISPFNYDPFNFFGQQNNQNNQNNAQPNVQQVGAGSGFFISADGLIVTNKHVVEDATASYTVLTSDGKKYDAKVLARDPVNDLAIVKVDIANAPYLSFADSGNLQIGQAVVAIGNSLGEYQNTVTSGIVSGIGRSITAGSETGSEQLSGVIQTDAAINPGNSGGPLLNIFGQVVGINTAIDQQGQLVGFAIPSNDIKKAVDSYQKNGKIVRPYLGVRYVIITPAIAQEQNLPRDFGALIIRGDNQGDLAVIPGSPADKAGLVENNIILEVNGQKVDDAHTLSSLLQNYNVGDTVKLHIYDKGSEKDVSVALGQQ